jgi:hypothetical protein
MTVSNAVTFTPAQSLVERGEASFRQVLAAQHAKPELPDFIFGTMPPILFENYFGRGHEWVHAQGVLEIETDMHWPHLLMPHTDPIEFTWANMHAGWLRQIWVQSQKQCRKIVGDHVLIAGPGHEIFGHWIVDFLPKLWVLNAAGYDLTALRYVVPDGCPTFGLELLRLCRISDEQIVRIERNEILVGRFLVPTTVHNGTRGPCFAQAADFLRKRMGVTSSRTGSKLLLSRAGAPQKRAVGNREAIERIAMDAGLTVVSPETLPLLDQFELIASADLVVGEYGSAMHSTLFAGPGLTVCAMRGKGDHPGFVQSAIGSALGQPTGYLFCEREPDDVAEGYTVPPYGFRACLHAISQRPAGFGTENDMKTEMHCWICRTDAAHCRCGNDTHHRARTADGARPISYPPADCDLSPSGNAGLMRLEHATSR